MDPGAVSARGDLPSPGTEPGTEPGTDSSAPARGAGTSGWTPGIPSVREHVPSLIFGAAVPIGVYFAVRSRVHTDATALIIAGCFSVSWILVQFVRQRRVDVVGAIVLFGFAISVVTSTLLGGNAYVLKVRDAAFSALFGVACIVTVFTHERPVFFYVSRYLSAGSDPERVSAFDRLHEVPVGRRAFRVLSVVWGFGLVVEASLRMTLAGVLPTGTFLVVTPFITGAIIGTLFTFTALYSKRTTHVAMALATDAGPAPGATLAGRTVAPEFADPAHWTSFPQIPLP